jgi:hypothetical protein
VDAHHFVGTFAFVYRLNSILYRLDAVVLHQKQGLQINKKRGGIITPYSINFLFFSRERRLMALSRFIAAARSGWGSR